MTDRAQTERFFERLFGRIWAPRWMLIWSLRDKGSRWVTSADAAAKIATDEGAQSDTYFGACLRGEGAPKKLSRAKRGGVADVTLLPAVWLDIDHKSPHRQGNQDDLPENIEDCWAIIEALGIRTSMVVASGYGLQPWWVLRDPILIDGAEKRAEAAALAEAFTRRAQSIARGLGFRLDSGHSIDHIQRIPGTINWKGEPRKVELIDETPSTWSSVEIAELCAVEWVEIMNRKTEPVRAEHGGPVVVRPDAEPPAGKLAAALLNDPKFRRTWERKRSDLKEQSQSTYDQSLACLAVNFGWSDQEIADLLIAHRRSGDGKPLESKARDYVADTVARARVLMRDRKIAEENEAGEVQQAMEKPADDRLKLLRDKLKIPVSGFVQREGNPSRYYLILEGPREVLLGPSRQVISQSAVRAAILDATGTLIAGRKQSAWEGVINLLFSILEKVPINEGERGQETIGWIESYRDLTAKPAKKVPAGDDHRADFENAFLKKRPFQDGKDLFISTEGLMRYLKTNEDVMLTSQELRMRLSEIGLKSERVMLRIGEDVFSRFYWSVNGQLDGGKRLQTNEKSSMESDM